MNISDLGATHLLEWLLLFFVHEGEVNADTLELKKQLLGQFCRNSTSSPSSKQNFTIRTRIVKEARQIIRRNGIYYVMHPMCIWKFFNNPVSVSQVKKRALLWLIQRQQHPRKTDGLHEASFRIQQDKSNDCNSGKQTPCLRFAVPASGNWERLVPS